MPPAGTTIPRDDLIGVQCQDMLVTGTGDSIIFLLNMTFKGML